MIKLNLLDDGDKALIKLNDIDITDSVLEYTVSRNATKRNSANLTLKMNVVLESMILQNEKIQVEEMEKLINLLIQEIRKKEKEVGRLPIQF